MQENKSIVEEALIQMKNVEDAIAENAKGILRSTMKEEIGQLVKESLSEQEEEDDEIEVDSEMDTDTEDDMDTEMGSEESDVDVDNEDDMDIEMDLDSEDEGPIDLTGASDEEILKIFKAMGEDDGIIVKKDGDDIHITDNNQDAEYLVKLGESEEDEEMMDEESDEELDEQSMDSNLDVEVMDEESDDMEMDQDVNVDAIVDRLFSENSDEDEEEEMDEIVYEIEMDEESDEEELDEEADDEEMDEELDEEADDEELDEEADDEEMDESYDHNMVGVQEAKMTVKPKGVGIGKPDFKYDGEEFYKSPKKMKQGTKGVGMGKAKFEYKEGENTDGKMKPVKKKKAEAKEVKTPMKKKVETKEAARTLGFGSKDGSRGLRKGITNNRNLTFESLETEVKQLREKNEEYRKALNIFRSKLNEVAIFNSNLAYATRLFTEHATTKKEKINILRRFDSVESLKESKNLYKSLKDELAKVETNTKSINESVSKIDKVVSTGSATNLIETKTYEAPQFLRIKDLMSKLG